MKRELMIREMQKGDWIDLGRRQIVRIVRGNLCDMVQFDNKVYLATKASDETTFTVWEHADDVRNHPDNGSFQTTTGNTTTAEKGGDSTTITSPDDPMGTLSSRRDGGSNPTDNGGIP